jgi:kynureninase
VHGRAQHAQNCTFGEHLAIFVNIFGMGWVKTISLHRSRCDFGALCSYLALGANPAAPFVVFLGGVG